MINATSIKGAPYGALYICPPGMLATATREARRLGRLDLKVAPPRYIDDGYHRGWSKPVAVDPNCNLTRDQRTEIELLRSCLVKPAPVPA